MAVTLTLTGKTPGQTQFGLDAFTEHYKCDATANIALTDPSVPQMGSAHPRYVFMFVTQRYVTETSESASALDLVYTGVFTGGLADITINDSGIDYVPGDQLAIASGGGIASIVVNSVGDGGEIAMFYISFNNFALSHTALPAVNIAGSGLGSGATFDVTASGDFALPATKTTYGTALQSTTSQCAKVGLSPNQPFTLQFYSKTTTYVFFSYLSAGATGTAPDPIGDPEPITLGFNDCSFIGGGTLAEFVENYFSIITSDVITSEEIVAGRYWINTEVKTKYYAQPIFGV